MFNRYPRDVPDQEKMDIFIDNLISEMSYQLRMQCPSSFPKMIENGLKIENAMVKKGELKLYNNLYNNNNNGLGMSTMKGMTIIVIQNNNNQFSIYQVKT